jgi:hypothetical protein
MHFTTECLQTFPWGEGPNINTMQHGNELQHLFLDKVWQFHVDFVLLGEECPQKSMGVNIFKLQFTSPNNQLWTFAQDDRP